MISVITATFNSEAEILKTYESIFNQTVQDWEWLITDDCSSDKTFEIITGLSEQDSRIHVFQNSILADNIGYRLGILASLSPQRPMLTNINRYNYVYVHETPKVKEIGASPGVFASFVIAFPIVFAPFFCGFYLGAGGSILSRIRHQKQNYEYSWVAAFFLYYFLITFLHSPINNLFTIGPEPVKLVLYFLTILLIAKHSSQKRFNI